MLEILKSFGMQVLMTVGVIFLFGFVISLCNRFFYSNLSRFGMGPCYITGFIGTPIHELSHALFCVIFGHKIKDIRLFQINSDDGTLGYVNHSYNPKNVYHQIGNFFIGIAPIIGISAVLYGMAHFLVPQTLVDINLAIDSIDVYGGFGGLFESVKSLFIAVFAEIDTLHWWIFVILGIFLALHMTLSHADIRGALGGLGIILAILLVANVILFFVGERVLSSFTSIVVSFGGYIFGFLSLSLVISLLAVVLSLIIKFVLGIFGK